MTANRVEGASAGPGVLHFEASPAGSSSPPPRPGMESPFNRTEFGKGILGACFVNDLGTVIALGLLFAPFTERTVIFIAVSALVIALLPRLTAALTTRYAYRTAAVRTKWVLLVLFGLFPVVARFREERNERWYSTLMMSTGLTFGTISALFGLSHGIVSREQYSFLVAGLIWCIQVVHYPLMDRVGLECFAGFHRQHSLRISLIVVPAMLVEAATALLLVVSVPAGVPGALPALGLGLLAIVWVSTFAAQVPLHARLARGFDPEAHRRLVNSNWLRTAAWSLRAALAIAIAVAA